MPHPTRTHREKPMDEVTGVAVPLGRRPASGDAQKRLNRLRRVAWLLDRSIPLGGKWRIGLDPLIGLVPGVGDWIGALLSLYVVYEGARLGLPSPVLTRMVGNMLVEAIVGAVPVLGDVFDFAWQSNMRNLALIEQHYRPELRARSLRKLWLGLAVFATAMALTMAVLLFLVAKALAAVFS